MHGAGDSALSKVKILTDLETGRNPHCSLDPWNTSCYDRKGRGIVLGLVIMSTDNNPTVTARPRGKGRDWFHCQSFKDAGGTAYHVPILNLLSGHSKSQMDGGEWQEIIANLIR